MVSLAEILTPNYFLEEAVNNGFNQTLLWIFV